MSGSRLVCVYCNLPAHSCQCWHGLTEQEALALLIKRRGEMRARLERLELQLARLRRKRVAWLMVAVAAFAVQCGLGDPVLIAITVPMMLATLWTGRDLLGLRIGGGQ